VKQYLSPSIEKLPVQIILRAPLQPKQEYLGKRGYALANCERIVFEIPFGLKWLNSLLRLKHQKVVSTG
jgi:hypothetical protein